MRYIGAMLLLAHFVLAFLKVKKINADPSPVLPEQQRCVKPAYRTKSGSLR